MRVTSLGVHGAFSTGRYEDSISVADARRIVQLAIQEGRRGRLNPENVLVEIDRRKQRAYFPKWHSNFLLEFDRPGKIRDEVFRLAIDCGGDIRHSLAGVGLTMADIDAWYISHPHSDHIGGVEGAALTTLFTPDFTRAKRQLLGSTPVSHYLAEEGDLPENCKPDLIAHRSVIGEVWEAAAPGLRTIQGVRDVQLSTYFHPQSLETNQNYRINDGAGEWIYYPIVNTHVVAGRDLMPSYGLMFESGSQRVYFPTDTQLIMPPQVRYFYDRATTVYMDCETGFPSGVHPHIDDLRRLPPALKAKMWLYHYQTTPSFVRGEFRGALEAGTVHDYRAVRPNPNKERAALPVSR